MTRQPLQNLNGFKFYKLGPQGIRMPISEYLTAEDAFELGLDLSQDGVKWYPAFSEAKE